MKKAILLTLAFFCALVLGTKPALAGFGITPPYFKNDSLTRNSSYKQQIVLVRGDPNEDLKAQVIIDVPEINGWFSIDKGNEFILPKGQKQVPIFITINVPEDAVFKDHVGYITIKTLSVEGPTPGTVGIVLGARLDVELSVVDKKIFDFKVRGVKVFDLEEGFKFWWLFFPGKIKFIVKLENIGNIDAAPTKVSMDIYNSSKDKMLESVSVDKAKNKVKPFEFGEVLFELPTRLSAGNYWAKYKIFKGEEVAQEDEVHLSILPYGTLPGYNGFGFSGLSLRDKASVIFIILLVLSAIGYGIEKLLAFLKKRKKAKTE